MKKILALALSVMMLFALVACGGETVVTTDDAATTTEEVVDTTAAETEEVVAEKKTFRVAMECAYAPYNWAQDTDANGAVAIADTNMFAYGYDVIIAKKIAEANNWNLEIVKLDWDSLIPALQAGTVALALNCGAYMSEIIRAGIQSVDVGQMEAARSLGLSYWRSMFRVVLPQAIKNMIPSIVNQFIITLKDTSILSVIGFPELVNKAQNVIAITFKSFEMWAIVAVMYLVVILALQQVANALERRLSLESK